ncbi:unnamed protein product [Ceutorhynchus assimilis]|uniref:Uncharacterized protein n=1 Tax=Ceutorhynchus assimilis TaxID=467358 RepID=A0A9N9QKI1_9CUCU|nr:unnamed protein product [Ceutorhynchus assimilis]
MTQKTSTEKVTKNIERPKPIRGNREVIRHFDPSTNTAAPYSNLDQNIPLVNVDPSEQKSASKPNKTVKISKASRTFKQNNKCRINLDIKSSSSSSLETKIKKFQSKSLKGGQPKIKSKSFHLGPTFTKPNENVVSNARERQLPAKPQNVVSSARERQLPAKPKNNTRLRSSTDPALLKKELNVRILKQEILDNKRETVQRALHPDAWVPIIDPRVEGLKSEILQSKTKNILNKKIFITELKSEVARYKHYENFMVYNVEEDEKKKQENNKQHLSNKKVPIGSEKPVALLYQNQKLQPNIDPSSDKSNRESNTSASTDRQEDCSGKALKNRATKSGQAAMNKKPLKFEKQMEFLKQYISERDGKSNIQSPQSGCSFVSDDEGSNTEISETLSKEPTPVETPLASPGTLSSTETLRKTKRKSNASEAFQKYMDYKKLKDNKPVDHLTKYFASVEETVRTFPLHLQIKIKSEFSSILHKAEFEAMSYYNQSKVLQQPL